MGPLLLALQAVALVLVGLCGRGEAGTLLLHWTNPGFQPSQDPDSCGAEGPVPETGLRSVEVVLSRFHGANGRPDSLPPFLIDEVGREAQAESVSFTIDDGTMGTASFTAINFSGQRSCMAASYLYAIPISTLSAGALGTYFADTSRTAVAFTRTDSLIAFDWAGQAPGPGMPVDYFSVRWTGVVQADPAGFTSFRLHVNDACKFWIDGYLVANDWTTMQGWHDVRWSIDLAAGEHTFEFDMWERTVNAGAFLYWTLPGGAESLAPVWH